jgi:hypothetical protein
MRSIQSTNRNLGIQNARRSAKTIVRNGSDRPSPRSLEALFGFASYAWESMRDALWHVASTATRVMKTRVTGGAQRALAQATRRFVSPRRQISRAKIRPIANLSQLWRRRLPASLTRS